MVGQIQRECEARDECMACCLKGVEARLAKLVDWRIKCIPHEENGKADVMVGVATALAITKSIMFPV